MSEPTVCRHCGYFINYVIPKAPAEPGWVHMPYTPTKPTGPHCDHPEPNDIDHTHPGDGTVPGLHGEPIPTPVLGCPACTTVHSIGGELGAAPDNITFSASIREKLQYDMDEGRLITESYPDGAVRQAIEIRKGLEDALVLEAVVLELGRRGYTVIPPEVSP